MMMITRKHYAHRIRESILNVLIKCKAREAITLATVHSNRKVSAYIRVYSRAFKLMNGETRKLIPLRQIDPDLAPEFLPLCCESPWNDPRIDPHTNVKPRAHYKTRIKMERTLGGLR